MTTATIKTGLHISSTAFEHEGMIPAKYTCEGAGISPPVTIAGLPEHTISLVLIMEDPDAPQKIFDHWIVWNIPPTDNIAENSIPGMVGKNSLGQHKYTGPCPPSGTHRYYFKLYALDTLLSLREDIDKRDLTDALQPHVIGYGELIGLYRKKKQ